jgi:hypothetical protein
MRFCSFLIKNRFFEKKWFFFLSTSFLVLRKYLKNLLIYSFQVGIVIFNFILYIMLCILLIWRYEYIIFQVFFINLGNKNNYSFKVIYSFFSNFLAKSAKKYGFVILANSVGVKIFAFSCTGFFMPFPDMFF